MSQVGESTTPEPARASRRVPAYRPIADRALTTLRVIADAEDAGLPFPTLDALADAAGLANKASARQAVMVLSDRRLIDGYGTTRRLTEAGWETLDP